MRVHDAINVARVMRGLGGHMAIGTLLGLWRIVKGTCTLAGDAAGLPVVVLVEAAEPAVVVHRHVEVNFMTRRAKFRRLLLHEWLEEDAPVRLGIQLDAEVM